MGTIYDVPHILFVQQPQNRIPCSARGSNCTEQLLRLAPCSPRPDRSSPSPVVPHSRWAVDYCFVNMVPGVAMKGVKLLRGESLDCLHMLYMLPTTSLELQGGY
ncbi:hypothetical protein IAQ61_001635 [Plenodomus lingam]|uniref:uncharacterized protein n=1 Tax=Leptosphaeria maculans TaxID=5022 RepID=UPI00332A10B3|nr:hypothetical protein IAQ61_001635 [Plenodomus lingam]